MKILVPVKRVLDPCVALRVKPDESGVDLSGARMSMNPFDEIAVEAAVRFKEAGLAREIVVVSCGAPACQETLRTALAMGADRALLVESEAELRPRVVARLLKAICERETPGLVICGKQAVDDDACQVGQMLAAYMGWAQATSATNLVIKDGEACVTRELEGGRETLRVRLPAVVTTELGLNEPRYATLPNIMKARKKPLEIFAAHALGVDTASRLTTLRVEAPPARHLGVRVADVAELARRLQGETAVLAKEARP